MNTDDPGEGNKQPGDLPNRMEDSKTYNADDPPRRASNNGRVAPLEVTLSARPVADTEHAELNSLIRYQIQATGFAEYQKFMDRLADGVLADGAEPDVNSPLAAEGRKFRQRLAEAGLHRIHGAAAYEVLSLATAVWLLTRGGGACKGGDPTKIGKEFYESDAPRFGVDSSELEQRVQTYIEQFITQGNAATPYLSLIVKQLLPSLPPDTRLDRLYSSRWECPSMIELIWSYWHEEGGQCQAMNAIALRFQNRKSRPGRDPLAALDIDPLRPLANLLWGWVESSYKRLTVERRAYEYDHHYGITLVGKAVPPLLSADSRSKFLEGFHSLLHTAHIYYTERADTTRIPDGFALLNALRHVHLILSEGAGNQFGDLPWTSRVEMMIEQWLLARPEMREFLRGRAMVPYQEGWMGQVDTMKKLQGWSDVTITHFHELATCGEAVLLAVRHGPWASTNDQDEAKTWADYWRPEIQRYIYAYKAATGVDLTLEPVNIVMPARLLHARMARQQTATGY